jgi:hypothetical protein
MALWVTSQLERKTHHERKGSTNTVFSWLTFRAMLVPEGRMTQAQAAHRDKMLALAREWRASGTPARVFAQAHGVTVWTLYAWRQRMVRDERSARRPRRTGRVRLAPVHVVPGVADRQPDLEIVLASGDRVRVASDVSVDVLRRVLQALRTAC